MLYYVTGTLGAGKSMYGARKSGRALLEGRVVATNMRFVEGWEHLTLRRAPHYKIAGKRGKAEFRHELGQRYYYQPELAKLLATRLHGKGEGRGLMVIDEAHNEMNNREWEDSNQKAALKYLTLGRKRGFVTYLISQHKDNTDAAARRIAAAEIRIVNWRQLTRVPFFGTPLLPFPLFLAIAFPTNQPAYAISANKVLFREVYTIGWYRNLYDTFEDFGHDHGNTDDPLATWLPFRQGMSVPPTRRGGAGHAAIAVGTARLDGGLDTKSANLHSNGNETIAQSKATKERNKGAA
jgi:hypothetical protein